ncbi:Peptidoglycan/LPS O-acetylase OafA/YrhL, contains acyltransferase and SGNH-hydrolase domains [Paenacidovorax caeni]|jgi:peptidoglycan/LPS O-acetylase OafA/YrhL|uniref:Peptidoglycan/LPS O-acetylase OafA/YrhL, contains acyltransferase and SGNH-hydrolase domains n=1 Tax=Paenacidovorax caeni TaxID=343013 RepID=A0A1I7IUF0_9BURK|nr:MULTISPECIES: acyltransferase family protein [Bacteria]EDT79944.1 acyltransferase 3 [Clostridium botulinum NCTC 2916]SFU76511.1 Peptidoglycan/LPS O-acetylase OafA/YrhL, contains acyltransferase and SGNH-hydrolase domains [Paenacidovorax caeni]
MPSPSRNALIDSVKGLACATIVAHHLAFYGPMSDSAHDLIPSVVDVLSEYGRMAVQVFLVLGGYLAAASLAPDGVLREGPAAQHIGRRFVRLIVPYAVALLVAVLAAALVRPFLEHPSVPGEPELHQLLANALLLQDIVGEEALSAGVWYVAIDFQLFACAVLLLAALRHAPARVQRWAPGMVAAGGALSLLVFNRMPDQDMWAWYFWGSYSLGMCAFWAARAPRAWAWGLGMAAVGLLALWLEFRARIAVALVAALLLMAVKRHGVAWRGADWLPRLGQMSYSVFLVHFSVCLLVNAVVNHLWPDAPWPNLLGMVLAFGLSIAAGRLLYLRVERHVPSWSVALRWQAGMVGTGMLVALASSRF